MHNLPQPATQSSSALARVGFYLLVPVVGLLVLPFLLLFIVLFYLLSLFQGARVFVFTFGQQTTNESEELQKPHFLEIQARPKELTDQSTSPTEY